MRTLGCSLMLVLLGAVGAGCGGGGGEAVDYAAWRPLLADELDRGRIDHPQDLYKFLFQGVMGPGHAVPDAAVARGWLDREWDAMDELATDRPPMILPLRPDGRLVRVDLVRLSHLAADQEAILDTLAAVFARTASAWPREPQRVAALWRAVVADTSLWRGRFSTGELAAFTDEVAAADWPAVHHSDIYRARLAPHYRVVDPALLPEAWR